MLEIKGKINTAICYANVIEEEAVEQIRRMCDYEFTEGSAPSKPLPAEIISGRLVLSKTEGCFQ